MNPFTKVRIVHVVVALTYLTMSIVSITWTATKPVHCTFPVTVMKNVWVDCIDHTHVKYLGGNSEELAKKIRLWCDDDQLLIKKNGFTFYPDLVHLSLNTGIVVSVVYVIATLTHISFAFIWWDKHSESLELGRPLAERWMSSAITMSLVYGLILYFTGTSDITVLATLICVVASLFMLTYLVQVDFADKKCLWYVLVGAIYTYLIMLLNFWVANSGDRSTIHWFLWFFMVFYLLTIVTLCALKYYEIRILKAEYRIENDEIVPKENLFRLETAYTLTECVFLTAVGVVLIVAPYSTYYN